MENPQFTPQFVLPTQGQSKLSAEDFEIELNRPPFFVPFPGDQGLDNKEIEKTIELPSSHQPRRHRVPPGERQNHLARRNILFEATIGRKYLGPPMRSPMWRMRSPMWQMLHHNLPSLTLVNASYFFTLIHF